MLPSRKEVHKGQRELFPKSILWITLKNKSRTRHSRICPVQSTSPCFHRGNYPKTLTHLQESLLQQDVQGASFRERNLPWFSPIISKKNQPNKPQRPSCPETRDMEPQGVISITLFSHSAHKLSFLKVRPPARGANPFLWYLRTVSRNPLNKAIKSQIKTS